LTVDELKELKRPDAALASNEWIRDWGAAGPMKRTDDGDIYRVGKLKFSGGKWTVGKCRDGDGNVATLQSSFIERWNCNVSLCGRASILEFGEIKKGHPNFLE